MKYILYDLSCTQPLGGKYHGGGKYAEAIFIKLAGYKNDIKIKIEVLYNSANYINPALVTLCSQYKIKMIDIANHDIISIIKRLKPEVYFTALPTKKRIFASKSTRMITVCHDLRTTEIYYDLYSWKLAKNFKDILFLFDSFFLKGKLQKMNMYLTAKKYLNNEYIYIIAVSNHTKYQILNLFPKINKEIPVFYSPSLHEISHHEEIETCCKKITKGNYLLMVSASVWLKNCLRATVALDTIFTSYPQITKEVVLVGVDKPNAFLSKIKNKEKFILLPYVNDSSLDYLYKNAYTLIYPSLGEGFGYPLLDAMRYEVPIIASAVSSITEIGGNAVLYFNPYSLAEIKNRCLQFLLDPYIYNSFKKKLLNQYNLITNKQKSDLLKEIQFIISK